MKPVQVLIKNSRLNIFILVILFLLGFSLLYFLYFRVRNQADVYVGLTVTRGINIPVNAPYNWIPYWLDNAIVKDDKEISPLGGLNAVVLDKESYEGSFYGKFVYLLLKVNAIKDRSGIYLFKNKPLSVGALIDLKLSQAQISGLVTYVGKDRPKYQYKKLLVKLLGQGIDSWVADSINVRSVITNNKGEEIVKVLDKIVSPASSVGVLSGNRANNRSLVTFDSSKKDVEITVELTANKVDGSYFYAETQKVKVDENLLLPFKEATINLPIISVTEM